MQLLSEVFPKLTHYLLQQVGTDCFKKKRKQGVLNRPRAFDNFGHRTPRLLPVAFFNAYSTFTWELTRYPTF